MDLQATVDTQSRLQSAAPSHRHWQRIGGRKRLGVMVPLFSARTTQSAGMGDFADIERLVDWCVEIGATVLQLLPLNDIGLGTSPYSALSALALDPTYISLRRLAPLVDDAGWLQRVDDAAAELEQAPSVQYARVRQVREPLLLEAFRRCRKKVEQDLAFSRFQQENPWLDGYVAYRVLKEQNGWTSWEHWAANRPARQCIAEAEQQHGERLAFHRFLQWVAAEQLRQAREYAEARGVLLKGDIPILVGRDSADVWLHPELFHLEATAGAPPDMYAAEGQNWGFPTYDWDRLAERDYFWWRQRLASIEQYFHLYRVDHVVGFFRIWTIPLGERNGLKGRFVPEDESRWGDHGRRLLSMMLDSCSLLPLGEDLGTVPDICRSTLHEMGIPGLKVARWEKRWHGDRSFIQPYDYPWLSVATSSTHDSETLAGWWAAYPGEREQLYRELGYSGSAPPELTPALAERLLGDLARAGSAFTILPLNDILFLAGPDFLFPRPEDNRVNVPGTCVDTNWTFRLPRTLERLLADERLSRELKGLLERG